MGRATLALFTWNRNEARSPDVITGWPSPIVPPPFPFGVTCTHFAHHAIHSVVKCILGRIFLITSYNHRCGTSSNDLCKHTMKNANIKRLAEAKIATVLAGVWSPYSPRLFCQRRRTAGFFRLPATRFPSLPISVFRSEFVFLGAWQTWPLSLSPYLQIFSQNFFRLPLVTSSEGKNQPECFNIAI